MVRRSEIWRDLNFDGLQSKTANSSNLIPRQIFRLYGIIMFATKATRDDYEGFVLLIRQAT